MTRLVRALLGSAALWILFVAGVKPQEMIVGAICISLTIAFSWYVAGQCSVEVRLRWTDVAQIRAVPWCILRDTGTILYVLAKDVLRVAPAESLYFAVPYTEISHKPAAIGERVLAVLYTTATPNSIVIGIDLKTRQMLFHQLKKSDIPTMTRHLGAQA